MSIFFQVKMKKNYWNYLTKNDRNVLNS